MKLRFLISIIAIVYPALTWAQESDSTRTYNLKEVVVTTSRMQLPLKDIPQKIELVNKYVLEAARNENLGDILKRVINLDIIQYPGALTTVGLRGFPATAHSRNYTLILIDGLPAGTNNLATIPSNFIERVEVVKGPYAVLYGSDAMGGVINIITKKSTEKSSGSVGFSVGNFGQTNYSGYISGAVTPKLLFSLGFSRQDQNSDYRIGSNNFLKLSELDKLILDKKSYGDVMGNTKYQINQFNGKLEYLINDKWSAKLYSTMIASNNIETPGNYWHSYGMSKKDIDRFANYAEIKYVRDNNELTISPYMSLQSESNYDNNTNVAFINSKERIRQSGLKIGNTHTWGNLKWLIGVDMDNYNVTSERYSGKLTPITPYRPDHNRFALSGFTQVAYSINNLSLNAGVRYNYITYTLEENALLKNEKQSEGYSNLNPSFGVKYNITPNLSLHGSIGNAFYVPDAYKTAGVYKIGKKIYVGNKDLKPETTTSYDLGINYSLGELINVDITYFQNFYRNKIVTDYSKKDTTSYKNVGKGRMNGLEFMLSSNLANFWTKSYRLDLYAGLTYFLNNTFDDTENGATVTKKSLYTRDMTANFGLNFSNNSGFEIGVNCRYIGHRLENDWMVWDNLRPGIKSDDYYAEDGYTVKDQILRHPAHLVFSGSVYYTFSRKVRVGISCSNLFDENYTEKDGYNMPGRSIMGHFTYKF